MDTSKIIKGVVNSGRYTVTAPIMQEHYGIILKIEGAELPETYQVDFSNDEHHGTSVTMIGNADGVLIPRQFIDTGKDVFAFLYWVGEDYGKTVYKFRIPNKVRPDRTNEEPTPEEQSVIDQCISALNEAVEQTAQDVIDADASAQSASGSAEQAESARDTAQTYANNAQTSATQASASASQASTSAGTASAAATSASASAASAYADAERAEQAATTATNKASEATTAAQTATTKAGEAQTSAQTASNKASEASQSASQASGYAQTAETAKTDAQTAKTQAETARDNAVTAKTAAETAQGKAEDAQAAAESVAESIPSDYSQLSEDVSDLKEDLSDISSMLYTYLADTSLWSQGRLSSTNGSGYSDTTTAIKSQKIPDNIEMVTALTGYKIAIFAYTKAENTYVGVWNGSELAKVNYYFEQTTVDISDLNSTYNIKLMARAISGENVTVDDAVNVLFGVKTLTGITDSIDAIKLKSDGLFNNGFSPLENVTWARGGWYASNDYRPSMYKYRACVYPAFTPEHDTVIVAQRGFKFNLYYSIGEDKYTVANVCTNIIPSGATAFLTVCRINEDTSEELTEEQVAEFGNAIMSVGYHSTDYTNYRDTFTGLEMYESMAIIGDSYSAGANGNSWGKCLDRMIGTSVTVWAQSGYDSSDWITTYLPRLLEADAKDLYWINLGINDGARVVSDPSYLGSSADVDETVYADIDTFPNTFWGNMGKIIRNIQNHAPTAKIVLEKTMFASMLNAQRDLTTTATATINSAIVEIGAFYGIPVIDQLDDAFYCSKEYAQSMTSNHPRKYTWVGMANANRRLFAKIVLANPEYFY